ncbi:hypothetical protein [Paenirhodobacter sp.]|uniref:hypothetical protein n=1 Tax=Paenirhodobacter sp. TaxID=1965326 RepID=UPI003B3D67CE
MRSDSWRNGVVLLTALFILAPVGLIVWQSVLTDAFFSARARATTGTYSFVLSDPGFWDALGNTVILSVGMVAIAVPLGSLLAFRLCAREYSTGIFLMAQGNEVMGTMLVSLWNGGNIDVAASLAVVNTLVVVLALRFGVRPTAWR